MSIGAALRHHAAADPGKRAVQDSARSLTRAELDAESDGVAEALHRQGVAKGDLVTMVMGNTVEFVVTAAALWKLGATPHPISPALTQREREQLSDGQLVLTNPPAPEDGPPHDEVSRVWKASSTGGSTGTPKVVLSGGDGTVDPETPTATFIPRHARQLVVGPLHHSAPFTYAMRGLMLGHELILHDRFDAEKTLQTIENEQVTWILLVPTTMQRISRLPNRDSHDVTSLQTVVHLGAPCPAWLKRDWLAWLGPEKVTEVYAGTESFGLTTIRGDEWLEHPGSVGRPANGFQFKIGDDGLVYSIPPRGPGSTYRYKNQSAATGWDTLGDLGWIDDEGYLYLKDRAADVILTGGENVYPAEVEAVLDEHPRVRSSAVFGLPDDDLGEYVHALVDSTGPVEDAWIAERLARIKRPKVIEYVEGPLRDDAGKVRRQALRAERNG